MIGAVARQTDEAMTQILVRLANQGHRTAADEFFAGNFGWKSLPERLQRLVRRLEAWDPEQESLALPFGFSENSSEACRTALTASVLVASECQPRPDSFTGSLESLFRYLISEWEENECRMDEHQSQIVADLHALGWAPTPPPSSPSTDTSYACNGIFWKPLQSAIRKIIIQKVRETIQGCFDTSGLYQTVCGWRDEVVFTWMLAFLMGPEAALSDVNISDGLKRELDLMTAQCFCEVRMDEIFDLVADYPDSHPAVMELREVLTTTKMHGELAQVLGAQLIKRLNHPGANTSQIIDVYIATIKVLRVIDPSDNLLGIVAEPVRSYLRGRTDTVRCIISSLTDAEVGGDLYQELRRQDVKPLENITVDSDDEEDCPDLNWQPLPSILKPRGTFLEGSVGRGDGDILAMLVSIYGSKELFVNEYRLMLADKLLVNLDYNTDNDVHTLELLKLRFGEMSMRNCEVMLKDIDDSKRTNTLVSTSIESQRTAASSRARPGKPVVDVATISHMFWPPLQQETLKHHPRVQSELDAYAGEFERLKNPRKLFWFEQLGSVDLELEVVEIGADGESTLETKEFICSPLLASLITHFEDKSQWTAEELSNETGIPEHVVEKRMTFWVNNRVLKTFLGTAHAIVYEIASASHLREKESASVTHVMHEDFGHEGKAVSLSAQEEEEMEVYESYIVGMLTNMQQLPLDRIHEMLKMFVTGSEMRYNKTPQQLHQFLQRLVRSEKLECGPDGMYKLFKK